eukprot:1899387-Rhodomonas_salina.1
MAVTMSGMKRERLSQLDLLYSDAGRPSSDLARDLRTVAHFKRKAFHGLGDLGEMHNYLLGSGRVANHVEKIGGRHKEEAWECHSLGLKEEEQRALALFQPLVQVVQSFVHFALAASLADDRSAHHRRQQIPKLNVDHLEVLRVIWKFGPNLRIA